MRAASRPEFKNLAWHRIIWMEHLPVENSVADNKPIRADARDGKVAPSSDSPPFEGDRRKAPRGADRRMEPRGADASPYSALYAPTTTHYATLLFFLAIAGVVWMGWMLRLEEYYTAKEGVGYYLGIAGSLCMVFLLIYPARKNFRFMRTWGAVKHYFRLHTILGIIGPVLILFHSNFRLNAINSNVALFSMLLVAASGIVGRFLYLHIHHRFYGRHLSLQELQYLCGLTRTEVEHEPFITPAVRAYLQEFEAAQHFSNRGLGETLWQLVKLAFVSLRIRSRVIHTLRRELKELARKERWSLREFRQRLERDEALVETYMKAVHRAAEFGVYERFFALWHVLHMPLFVILVVTAIVHVVAVHMY